LIGEEFFAASAYLSGEPDQLGSIKGQDVGKIIVAVGIAVGVVGATIAALTGSSVVKSFVDFLTETMLT
jgi:VIT1/CCC1 family predicted Fe2+/Mn2+ transporter